jgi:hypothetical protein
MVDSSLNASGATPYRVFDQPAVNAVDALFPDDGEPSGLPGINWYGTALTYGTTVYIYAISIGRRCYWQVAYLLVPRWAIWSNAVWAAFTPPDRRNLRVGTSTNFFGSGFGDVQPFVKGQTETSNGDFRGLGWSYPPQAIPAGAFNMNQDLYVQTDTQRAVRSPEQFFVDLVPDPFKGWRGTVLYGYTSVDPINCATDFDGRNITLAGGMSAADFAVCSEVFGLSQPATTITMRRLSDIT